MIDILTNRSVAESISAVAKKMARKGGQRGRAEPCKFIRCKTYSVGTLEE